LTIVFLGIIAKRPASQNPADLLGGSFGFSLDRELSDWSRRLWRESERISRASREYSICRNVERATGAAACSENQNDLPGKPGVFGTNRRTSLRNLFSTKSKISLDQPNGSLSFPKMTEAGGDSITS
jgi:hypothetical protein